MLKHLDKAHFGNPPKVEIGADGDTRYRGEADDLDNLSSALPVPLSSEMPPTEGHVIEGSANKRSKQYDPHGSPPGERGANTESSHPDRNEHIPESQSLHSLEQARCCLKRFRRQARRQIRTLPSTLDLNKTLVYPGFDLSAAASVCTIQVPRRSYLIQSEQSLSQCNYPGDTSTSLGSNPSHAGRGCIAKPNNFKGIICTILTRPHRMDVFLFSGRCMLGIPHSPCKLGIFHRRRQLLLPTLHMEEIVNFLVDKEKEGRGTT